MSSMHRPLITLVLPHSIILLSYKDAAKSSSAGGMMLRQKKPSNVPAVGLGSSHARGAERRTDLGQRSSHAAGPGGAESRIVQGQR